MEEARLEDFEIGPVLGQGGMATVYRATDRRSGEVVALKLMLANVADDPTFIERFRREARSTMALQHENICRVIAAGEGDGKLFMAMEVIDGGSVRELKQKFGGRVPLQLAAEIVGQLIEALAVAHDHGVVHRDLKPANLMLNRAGKLKLVDFGIAKTSSDATLTATGMLVGTPAFMSPEQVRGDPLDGRSDLFSSGLILHDLLCGRSPYYSDNPGTSLMKVLQEDVPSVFDVLFGIDAHIEAAHGKLTAKNRDERFADARAAAAALRAYREKVRARNPNLVADCIRNPAGMKQLLFREQAEAEVMRARSLVHKHGPVPAAALAYENATHLDASWDDARDELAALAPQLGFHTDLKADPRIDEAMAQLKMSPTNAGVLKRLADLHRAAGNLRESARFMKRYLRQKDDSAALQQLVTLLYGPGSDPGLVTGTLQRLAAQPNAGALRTQDIVAGVKTGGSMRPQSPLKERTQAGLSGLDAEKKAAIARAAAGRTGASSRPQPRTTSEEAQQIRELSDPEQGLFSQIREQLGGWFWLGVAGAVVVVMIVIASQFILGGVQKAQEGLKKNVEGEAINEEVAVFNWQVTKLKEARAALEAGSFVKCSVAATQALEGDKTVKLMRDAWWLQAQCALLAGDMSQAKDALETFSEDTIANDPRYAIAKTQLQAIARGENPGGVRKW